LGSLFQDSSGTWLFEFSPTRGRRVRLRLSDAQTRKEAKQAAKQIEQLIHVRQRKLALPESLNNWLQQADVKLVNKLNELGLCPRRNDPTVNEFVADYLKRRPDLSAASLTVMGHTERNLLEYFGPYKLLREVTLLDAREFRLWLLKEKGLAANTVNRRCGFARQYFHDAMELGLITTNPFLQKSISTTVGPASKDFIDAATIEKVIASCADPEWQLLFACSRYLGCRIPSEIRDLTRADVDLQAGTILLRSPKTRRHHKTRRLVPIFPQLRPHLQRWIERADADCEYLFPRLRRHANQGTEAKRLVKKAGIEPWGDFFNTLRASRETELMDQYGLRKACQWIGNTPGIAMRNYSLLRHTAYEDEGGLGPEKSVVQSVVIPADLASFGLLQNAENPVFPGCSGYVVDGT
jgi:integrase